MSVSLFSRARRALAGASALAIVAVGLAAAPAQAALCADQTFSIGARSNCVRVARSYLGMSESMRFDRMTQTNLKRWQEQHGLEASGRLTPQTWAALVEGTAAEPAGAGNSNAGGAENSSAGWDLVPLLGPDGTPVVTDEGIPVMTMAGAANGGAAAPAEPAPAPAAAPAPAPAPAQESASSQPFIPAACQRFSTLICASQGNGEVLWIKDGVVQMRFDARFGSARYPTRNGVFRVNRVSRDHYSRMYNASMPFALFFDGGRAVHYSPDFAAGIGTNSHGCVNLRDYNGARALFDSAGLGTRVVVTY